MGAYPNIKTLKENWYILDDLLAFLQKNGYSSKKADVKRWEEWGVIPQPKTIDFSNNKWRVFSKNGQDFETILSLLEKHTKKIVIKPK